jgi:hypothetical protein
MHGLQPGVPAAIEEVPMSNEEAVWEDPPVNVRSKGAQFWFDQAELAKSRPGEWLRVPGEHNAAQSYNITSNKIKAFSTGVWEAKSRRVSVSGCHIYVRYMGEK